MHVEEILTRSLPSLRRDAMLWCRAEGSLKIAALLCIDNAVRALSVVGPIGMDARQLIEIHCKERCMSRTCSLVQVDRVGASERKGERKPVNGCSHCSNGHLRKSLMVVQPEDPASKPSTLGTQKTLGLDYSDWKALAGRTTGHACMIMIMIWKMAALSDDGGAGTDDESVNFSVGSGGGAHVFLSGHCMSCAVVAWLLSTLLTDADNHQGPQHGVQHGSK